MYQKFRAIAAQVGVDKNGVSMTQEQLEQFQGHKGTILLRYMSNMPVGSVLEAHVEEGMLVVTGELYKECLSGADNRYVGVSYKIDSFDGEVIPMEYGIFTESAEVFPIPLEILE